MATSKLIPIKNITSWSFTRYNTYRKCPAMAKYKFIDKLKEPPSDAMARGDAIHKMAEAYVKATGKPKLPTELKLFKDDFARLRGQKVKFVEESWVFKKDWSLTEWNDWNGAWLRVKLDVAYINTDHNALVPIDYKTGKYRPDNQEEYKEQLELYALAGLIYVPTVDIVSPRLWYLDHGIVHPNPDEEEIVYERKDLPYLKKLWLGKTKKMLADTSFKPTPGDACRFCHFRKSNNGPCKY